MEILFIRHGETAWNAEQRLQGHLDIPLNAEGERQAAALGRHLLAEPLDAILSSDLQRAMQTAQAIAAPRRMTVRFDAAWRERCFGAFEGLRHAEIEARYPAAYRAWRQRDADERYPGAVHSAETLKEFTQRITDSTVRLADRSDYRKVAVVTHGGVLDCLYRMARGMDVSQPRDFDVLNASINRMVLDGAGLRIIEWANVAHLADSALDELNELGSVA